MDGVMQRVEQRVGGLLHVAAVAAPPSDPELDALDAVGGAGIVIHGIQRHSDAPVGFRWEPVDIDSRVARLQVAHGIRTDPVLGKVLTKAVKQILLKRHYKYPLIESAIISPTV